MRGSKASSLSLLYLAFVVDPFSPLIFPRLEHRQSPTTVPRHSECSEEEKAPHPKPNKRRMNTKELQRS